MKRSSNQNSKGSKKFKKDNGFKAKDDFRKDKKNVKGSYQKTDGFSKDKTKRNYQKDRNFDDALKNENSDYVYGVNSVREAILSGRTINSLYVAKGKRSKNVHEIITMCKEQKILIKEVDANKLKKYVNTDRHQGVVAYISPLPYYDLDEIIKDDAEFVVALDGITDVHNFGAILRTVDATGFKHVIIPERKSVAINSALSRTSVGAVEYLKLIRVKSLGNALRDLREKNYFVVGSDMNSTMDYRDLDYSGKLVLVIGSEGTGMRKHIAKLCDFNIAIPMLGKINSLNASVSASIILYEKMRNMSK